MNLEKKSWERKVIGRARRAVACLVEGSSLPGEEAVQVASGAVIGLAAAALAECLAQEEVRWEELLRDGVRWRDFLENARDRSPILREGFLGQGVDALLRRPLNPKANSSIASFLEVLFEGFSLQAEWSLLHLLGAVYGASLAWVPSGSGLGRSDGRVKEQGSVYTPEPVVRLIVQSTIGPLLAESSEACVMVCDPSCGAGAFLLEAMRLMEEEALRRGAIEDDRSSRLAFRRGLVEGHLWGVDLDPRAVSLCRLVLWLASAGTKKTARALERSIRQGNALVGAWRSDLALDGKAPGLRALRREMDSWCRARILSSSEPLVHWEVDFPRIFPPRDGPGGWDALIGNPPYGRPRALKALASYLEARYPEVYTGYADLSFFFLALGLRLLKPGGRLGYLVPSYWFQNTYGEKLRRFLARSSRVEEVVIFGPKPLFPGRGIHPSVLILSKSPARASRPRTRVRRIGFPGGEQANRAMPALEFDLPSKALKASGWVFAPPKAEAILEKATGLGRPLGELFHIEKGPTSGCNEVFTLDEERLEKHRIEEELLRPCIKNSDIRRYGPLSPKRWLIYLDGKVGLEGYPRAKAYLELHRDRLASRREVRQGLYPWWRLERPRSRWLFEARAKLVVPYRARECRFSLDEMGCFNDGGDIRVLVPRRGVPRGQMLAALAIANSASGCLIYSYLGKAKGPMLEFFVRPLASVPLGPPEVPWDEASETRLACLLQGQGPLALARRVSSRKLIPLALALLAERMLALHREESSLQAIEETDEAIDYLVARLFGLTPSEEALAARARRAGGLLTL